LSALQFKQVYWPRDTHSVLQDGIFTYGALRFRHLTGLQPRSHRVSVEPDRRFGAMSTDLKRRYQIVRGRI